MLINYKYLAWVPLITCWHQLNAETTYKFADAVKQGLVSAKIYGAKTDSALQTVSGHYGPCLAMELVNQNNFPISLSLEYGYKMEPEDTFIQTMMVTQALVITLKPRQKKFQRVYAMCTEATDGGPNSSEKFHVGKRVSGNLLNLAALINKKDYQNDAAQSAVWCLTNKYSMYFIYSTDTTMMYTLRRFIAKATGIPASKIYEQDANPYYSYSEPPQQIVVKHTVYSGSFTYSIIGKPSKVLIALFDENNHMKNIYVNNEMQHEGDYTYKYQINGDEASDKKTILRMYIDGKLEEEIPLLQQEN